MIYRQLSRFQDIIGTLGHKHVLNEVIHQYIYKYK